MTLLLPRPEPSVHALFPTYSNDALSWCSPSGPQKKQGKVRNVHRNVCGVESKICPVIQTKEDFQGYNGQKGKFAEKNLREWEEGFGIWKSTVISSEMIEVGSRNREVRQEVQDRLETYLRMCAAMRRKMWQNLYTETNSNLGISGQVRADLSTSDGWERSQGKGDGRI